MTRPLQNMRALVTGGSRGIGAAIVQRLARDGAHVALTYVHNAERAEASVQAARAFGGQALAIQADSADAGAVAAAVEHTVGTLGGIDILVNNIAARHQTLHPSGHEPLILDARGSRRMETELLAIQNIYQA